MNESSPQLDIEALDELIVETTRLLEICDEYGLSLVAIDLSGALDKLDKLRAGLVAK